MRHFVIAASVAALIATSAFATSGTGIGKGNNSSVGGMRGPHPVAVAPAVPVSGILIVHHRVADYAKWRPVFDAGKADQEAAGLTNPRVYCGKSPNDVVIMFDMADEAKAKAFAASKGLHATMKKAGVRGAPEILYLTPEQ